MSILNLYPGSGGGVVSAGGIPSGFIGIWSGSEDNVPDGWHICDGTEGTPDLRDKFVLGAGESHPVGEDGGEETVTLGITNMPSHAHDMYLYNGSGSNNSLLTNGLAITNSSGAPITTYGIKAAADSSMKGSIFSNITRNKGSGNAHNNMPPYYTLCYIMKL